MRALNASKKSADVKNIFIELPIKRKFLFIIALSICCGSRDDNGSIKKVEYELKTAVCCAA